MTASVACLVTPPPPDDLLGDEEGVGQAGALLSLRSDLGQVPAGCGLHRHDPPVLLVVGLGQEVHVVILQEYLPLPAVETINTKSDHQQLDRVLGGYYSLVKLKCCEKV